MKFLSLHMRPYGSFDDKELDFAPQGAGGLHLIYGPNGAGKSTTLRALRAVLFGLAGGADAHRFPSKDLRLGAHLQRSSGEELEYLRRTASKSPLWLPSDDEALAEEQLSPFLGGMNRERFVSIYGLDLETMQAGGRELVKGEGDIGKALFGAALGGKHLASILERMQVEASKLYADNSSKPSINRCLADLKALDKERNRHTLTVTAYSKSRKAWEASKDAIEKLEEERKQVQGGRRELEQRLNLLSPLRRLERTRKNLAGFEGQEPIAEVDIRSFRALNEELHTATIELSRLKKMQQTRVAVIEGLKAKANPDLLESEQAVRDIQGQVAAYEQALVDIPDMQDQCNSASGQASAVSYGLSAVDNPEQALQILARLAAERRSARMELESATTETGHAVLEFEEAKALSTGAAGQFQTDSRVDFEALAPFRGDFEELAKAVPPAETVIAERMALEKERASDRENQLQAVKQRLRSERVAKSKLLALESDAGGMPPTDEELHSARQIRDAAWTLLHDELAGNVIPSPLPDLAAKISAADRIVDRLRGDGVRAVSRMTLETELREIAQQQAQLEEHKAEVALDLQQQDQVWSEAWQTSGMAPMDAQAMRDWVQLRARLLQGLAQHKARAQEAEAKAERDYQVRAEAQSRLESKVQAVEERWSEWSQRTGFDPEITEELAAAELNAVISSGVAAQTLFRLTPRLKKLQDLTMEVEQQARNLAELSKVARLHTSKTESEQALERIKALGEALADATRVDVDLEQKEKDQELDRGSMARITQRLQELNDSLGEQRSKYRADSEADFRERVDSADRLAILLKDKQLILEELGKAAPGQELEGLLMQFQGVEPEVLAGEIESELKREQDLAARVNELHVNLGNLGRDVEGEGSEEAIFVENKRASLIASVGDETERYIQLELARYLLEREIEQHRLLHQGPLLKRAGELFKALTNGTYIRLVPSEDRGKPVMVARRAGGQLVGIGGMSSGTEDQLYLALRIASVELMIRTSEPMPFIADDLFVNFDDKRTEAALRVLFELSKTTQVIVFSHHESVLACAKKLAAKDIPIQVHRLLSESARESQRPSPDPSDPVLLT
jgi:uncharacterized protein YhaN